MREFTKYPSDCIEATTESEYPYATLCFVVDGVRHHMVSGRLGSPLYTTNVITAMKSDDDFAVAMADVVGPELNNQVWEDTTYEYVATNAVDWFKQDYDEWKSLKDRGREDSDFWSFISNDESIEVLS